MADSKRIVMADEGHLRTALRQQLRHNEQQNLAMGEMSKNLGRAGRLTTEINKLLKKVESGEVTKTAFHKTVFDLMEKFNMLNARGKGAKRG